MAYAPPITIFSPLASAQKESPGLVVVAPARLDWRPTAKIHRGVLLRFYREAERLFQILSSVHVQAFASLRRESPCPTPLVTCLNSQAPAQPAAPRDS